MGGTLAALVCFTGIDSAKALDFNFSFDNTVGSVAGTVEGTIQGLNDNSTGAASAVLITNFPAGLPGSFDIGNDAVLWNTVSVNSFTVTNGAITAASFDSRTTGSNDVLCLNSDGSGCVSGVNALQLDGSIFTANVDGFSGATYSAATPVPFETEPTLGILLAAGLFGSRHLYRRHRARKVLLDK